MITRNKLQFWAEPRNTISIQVLRHELEIAQHSLPTPLHGTRRRSVTDGRLPTDLMKGICPSGKKNEKKKKTRREKKSANRSGHRYMTHIAPPYSSYSPSFPPPLHPCHPKMFSQCFTIQSFSQCSSGTCELDGKRGGEVAETPRPSRSVLASCHRAGETAPLHPSLPHPPPRRQSHSIKG